MLRCKRLSHITAHQMRILMRITRKSLTRQRVAVERYAKQAGYEIVRTRSMMPLCLVQTLSTPAQDLPKL